MPSRVYVIELTAAAGRRRDPRIPWVYVGSSARGPEVRFVQHLRGYKSSGIVKRHALRLRPDLYEDLPAFPGSKTAQRAEIGRARELAAAGFVAHSDGTSYGKWGGDWAEWDEARLAPVISHLDRAIAQLGDSSFVPISPEVCVRLLGGERGFWVAEYLDQDDPPPAYGQFSHVRPGVLLARAEAKLGHGETAGRFCPASPRRAI